MLKGFGAFLLIELVDLSLFNLDESDRIRMEGEIVREIVIDKGIKASAVKIGTSVLETNIAGTDAIGSFIFLEVVNHNTIHLQRV